MQHEQMMQTDKEYARTWRVLKNENLSLETILEVVVKSNALVGVGIVSLKDGIDSQLNRLMRGY